MIRNRRLTRDEYIDQATDYRDQIDAYQIIDMFQRCMRGELKLDRNQIRCGEALLDRSCAKIKTVSMAGLVPGLKDVKTLTTTELEALVVKAADGDPPETTIYGAAVEAIPSGDFIVMDAVVEDGEEQ